MGNPQASTDVNNLNSPKAFEGCNRKKDNDMLMCVCSCESLMVSELSWLHIEIEQKSPWSYFQSMRTTLIESVFFRRLSILTRMQGDFIMIINEMFQRYMAIERFKNVFG